MGSHIFWRKIWNVVEFEQSANWIESDEDEGKRREWHSYALNGIYRGISMCACDERDQRTPPMFEDRADVWSTYSLSALLTDSYETPRSSHWSRIIGCFSPTRQTIIISYLHHRSFIFILFFFHFLCFLRKFSFLIWHKDISIYRVYVSVSIYAAKYKIISARFTGASKTWRAREWHFSSHSLFDKKKRKEPYNLYIYWNSMSQKKHRFYDFFFFFLIFFFEDGYVTSTRCRDTKQLWFLEI